MITAREVRSMADTQKNKLIDGLDEWIEQRLVNMFAMSENDHVTLAEHYVDFPKKLFIAEMKNRGFTVSLEGGGFFSNYVISIPS